MLKSKTFTARFVPAPRPGPEGKVLVVLHGLGDSLEGFTWLPPALKLPELSYLLVNAPDPYYGGFSWFDFPADPAPGILRSRGLVAGLLAELLEQGRRAEDIFLLGFSQGCLMALDAGLRSDLPLGGVIGVSGWVAFLEEYPAALSPAARRRKFLVTHGTQDPLLPFEVTADQCRRLRDMGLDLEFKAYDKEHTMLPEEVMDIRAWLAARLG
jgi:phospholipase/carboxylesterase